MAVPRARLLELMKAQCQIFSTTYNPDGLRLGTKVLRQRLKGPTLANYYPRRTVTVAEVMKSFGPAITSWDDREEDRLEKIEGLTERGKNAPKKLKKPKGASKKGAKK